jgi:voltage-gated potassium channel
MVGRNSTPGPGGFFIDRRIRRISRARSVTLGLALTFLGLSIVSALVIWLADGHDFPTFGLAVWWALQTVTTVGYGDVVPTTDFGRIVGGIEMVFGVSFIAFLTAGVTSTVIRRESALQESAASESEQDGETMIDALAELRQSMRDVDRRLANIESKLGVD